MTRGGCFKDENTKWPLECGQATNHCAARTVFFVRTSLGNVTWLDVVSCHVAGCEVRRSTGVGCAWGKVKWGEWLGGEMRWRDVTGCHLIGCCETEMMWWKAKDVMKTKRNDVMWNDDVMWCDVMVCDATRCHALRCNVVGWDAKGLWCDAVGWGCVMWWRRCVVILPLVTSPLQMNFEPIFLIRALSGQTSFDSATPPLSSRFSRICKTRTSLLMPLYTCDTIPPNTTACHTKSRTNFTTNYSCHKKWRAIFTT